MVAIKSKEDYRKKPASWPATKKPAALKGSARSDKNSEEGHRLCQFFTMIVPLHSYGKVLLVLGKEHIMISYIHAQVRLVVKNVPTRMLCMMAVKLFVKKVIASQLSMWILPTVLNVIRVVK